MSRLNINFGKSALIAFGCDEDWVHQMRLMLCCSMVKLSILYLGISLGANPRRTETWKLVIEKVRKWLSLWKAKLLSRVGRLVLIKLVLNSLLLFYLSIFRIPNSIALQIIKLQRRFFWVLDGRRKAIPLISWDVIQKLKEMGGLGVSDLVVKNTALLFKWWWRFSNDSHLLWKRVVCSIHNISQNDKIHALNSANSGRLRSLWGQITNMARFWDEALDVTQKGFHRKVGVGSSSLFWVDQWVGEISLKERFPWLFSISSQK